MVMYLRRAGFAWEDIIKITGEWLLMSSRNNRFERKKIRHAKGFFFKSFSKRITWFKIENLCGLSCDFSKMLF